MDTRTLHQEEALPLHKVPDSGTGKGVFVQYVPNKGPPVRGGQGPESDRETGQDLVSEPAHEDEENEQRKGRNERTLMWTAVRATRTDHCSHWDRWTDVSKHTMTPPTPDPPPADPQTLHTHHFVGFCIFQTVG